MTRFGFLALAIALGGAAAVCAIFAVITFSLRLAPPTDLECDELAEARLSGRVRLHGCSLDFGQWQAEDRRFDTVTVLAVGGGAPSARRSHRPHPRLARVLYRTDELDVRSRVRHLAELGADLDAVERYLERHEAELSRPRTLEGRVVSQTYKESSLGPNLRVVDQSDDVPYLVAAIALLFALLFGLFFALLVRKQRRWEAARLAWERSRGVLVPVGESPRTF